MARALPIELCLLMKLAKATILKQTDLHKLNLVEHQDDVKNYHIYFICKRPRVSVVPSSFKSVDGILDIDFKVHVKDSFEIYNLKLKNEVTSGNLEINSSYPYTRFELIDVESKEVVSEAESSLFIQILPRYYTEANFLDLEILYIGQAFGNDGDRNAVERLSNHSTLQRIYSESIQNNPDSEIWLFLTDFEEIDLALFSPKPLFGDENFSKKELDYDSMRHPAIASMISGKGFNKQQKINFTEAALIKYFKPPYNKIYKDSFPNPAHKTYSDCYDLKINSIAVELNTMDTFNFELYSESIQRLPNHMFHFTLHTKEERRSMFEILPGMPLDDLQNPWQESVD